MAHFGDRLRQQRLARGVSLSQIAADTRIIARYLEALENHDFKQLPGAIFARSFARQYADYVGLDFALIQAEVAAAFPSEEFLPVVESLSRREGIQIKPLTEWLNLDAPTWSRLPRPLLTLGVVLLACSGVYWGWQRVILGVSGIADRQVPEVSAIPPTKLPTNHADILPAAPLATVSSAAAETAPAPQGTTSLELQAPPGSSAGVAVRVVATQETWVSITANGKRLFRGVLQPNEARLLTGVEKATMIIGNAGGVDVQTDGRSIGPIGPSGQVRVVNLSPQGMEIKRQSTGSGADSTGTS